VRIRAFTILLIYVVFTGFRSSSELKPARILLQMYDSIRNIRTLRYHTSAIERIDKNFLSANSEIRIQTHPRKVYFKNPVKKIEVLYNAEHSAHKAIVKANVFPYMPMQLDPTGALMRRNQHYTIHELGFEFIGKSIALTIKKDREGLGNFTYHGKSLKNGYNCYLLEYENKNYTYVDYRVGEKESASLIAYRLCVNDYLLRHRNDLLNDFSYLKKGRILKVPSLYCKKAVVYIDDRLMLPVSISLYDDHGLFENYEFTGIEINKPFREKEFSRDFEEYGF
jgi:hypothetical protein